MSALSSDEICRQLAGLPSRRLRRSGQPVNVPCRQFLKQQRRQADALWATNSRREKGRERREIIIHYLQSFVISPPFPCFSAFPHILFFRCCSTQSPLSASLSWRLLLSCTSVAEDVGSSPISSQTLYGKATSCLFPRGPYKCAASSLALPLQRDRHGEVLFNGPDALSHISCRGVQTFMP